MPVEINMKDFCKKFAESYNDMALSDLEGRNLEQIYEEVEATKEFDINIKDGYFAEFVADFVKFSGHLISSDREAAAFMFALCQFV